MRIKIEIWKGELNYVYIKKKLKLSIDKCVIMIYTMYIIRNGGNKKMKNKILKAINYIMAFIFLFFACLLDSDTWIPYIVCCVCLAWFILFMFVNREYLRKHGMMYWYIKEWRFKTWNGIMIGGLNLKLKIQNVMKDCASAGIQRMIFNYIKNYV